MCMERNFQFVRNTLNLKTKKCHTSCEFKHLLLQLALFTLQTPTNDGNIPADFDSLGEMSVRIRRGGFMIKRL